MPLPAKQEPKHWAQAKEHIQEAGPDTGMEFYFPGAEILGFKD